MATKTIRNAAAISTASRLGKDAWIDAMSAVPRPNHERHAKFYEAWRGNDNQTQFPLKVEDPPFPNLIFLIGRTAR